MDTKELDRKLTEANSLKEEINSLKSFISQYTQEIEEMEKIPDEYLKFQPISDAKRSRKLIIRGLRQEIKETELKLIHTCDEYKSILGGK